MGRGAQEERGVIADALHIRFLIYSGLRLKDPRMDGSRNTLPIESVQQREISDIVQREGRH